MSPALIGGLAGLALAVVDYFVLGHVKRTMERTSGLDPRRSRAVDIARMVQFVAFPVIGFIAGPYVLAANGG